MQTFESQHSFLKAFQIDSQVTPMTFFTLFDKLFQDLQENSEGDRWFVRYFT
jgi:hypothetical protein